ncbi:MAG TPA: AAA family ATPase [Rhizobacter sp.]|nr:AAA family ATPase [Rhizobacter sp.]
METPHPATASSTTSDPLRICLLGELRVLRAGHEVPLPASKRTRALLGYLVSLGRAETRQTLCDLLWDGPDDPRAEMRWSLSKLRPVVDAVAAPRICADRERVAFDAQAATTDVAELNALIAPGPHAVTLAALEQAAALFTGEFLDGLELPACYRFHQWCMAERERHGALRLKVIRALVQRLHDAPERALVYARALVAADPSSEAAHAHLVRLLVSLGRARDAQLHCQQTEAMFRREFGVVPGDELRLAARQLSPRPQGAPQPTRDVPPSPAATPVPGEPPAAAGLLGRGVEQGVIADALASLGPPLPHPLLLFVGEPGIGKTSVLDALASQARDAGCRVLRARCYEAEMTRPYGVWIDALRSLPAEALPVALAGELRPLRGAGAGDGADHGDRARLFAACAALVKSLAQTSALVVILDDLQWLDEGSAALLHYVARSIEPTARVRLAGAARQGEIDDNPWAKRVVQSLEKEQRLLRHALGPLDGHEVAQLLARMAPTLDVQAVHRRSGGNPLLVLALAQAQAGAGTDLPWSRLIDNQVQGLDDASREMLIWASAMGREFRLETLTDVMASSATELLTRLQRLESRGLLKPTAEGRYDFAHDLVREAVYHQLSQPRRRAIHRQIARALVGPAAADASLQGELMHHASQADDAALAVKACIATAEHCLRVFANTQAAEVAERGLALLDRLPAGADRVTAHIALLKLRVVASVGPGDVRMPQLTAELNAAIESAEWLGQHAAAASGLHILSWLAYWANDAPSTVAATLRAERLSRESDSATHCLQLANTGRCLLEVESDVAQARALVQDAAQQAEALKLHVIELLWARGLVARWDGDLDEARRLVRSAVDLAHLREDRWREFECLVWLAKIELENGRLDAVDQLCAEVSAVAARMRDVTVPVSAALRALTALLRQAAEATSDEAASLADSLAVLRSVDDKTHLAYVLNHVAAWQLERGQLDQVHAAASEAAAAAQAVGRSSEIAVAHALLAKVAACRGQHAEAASHLRPWVADESGLRPVSARARSFIELACRPGPLDKPARNRTRIPTPAPTKAD